MILEIVFKLAPTVLIAGFNLRIMIVYRRTCDKRRRMTLSRINTKDEDPRKFAEERRLMMLLGGSGYQETISTNLTLAFSLRLQVAHRFSS